MTPTTIEIYKTIFDTWRWQVDSYWQRSSYFAAFETAAIAGCWYLVEKKNSLGVLLALLGILLTAVWFLNNRKTHGYVEYWWKALGQLEANLGAEDATFVTRQSGSHYLPYRALVQAVPVIFLAAWSTMLVLAAESSTSLYLGSRGGRIMRSLITNAVFWYALTAIFTGIASVGIILAYRQLRFQAWLKAQEIWSADDFTERRGRIFARLDDKDRDWSKEEKSDALQACRKMDEFAGLIPRLPKRIALRVWGVPFAKAWLVLEPIVNEERAKCGWQDKWHAFEQLGTSALRNHPEVRKVAPKSSG
jgi:hypothetical protein